MFPRSLVLVVASTIVAVTLTFSPAAASAASGTRHASGIHRLVVKESPSRSRDGKRWPSDDRGHDRRKQDDASTNADTRAKAHRESNRATVRSSERRAALRAIAREERAAQREKAAASDRADRIYALSQTNAPILTDTRACKRTDARGQSIFENCALAGDGIGGR